MARSGKSFKLSRDKDHQRALFRNLISALIINERIKTTEAKAKALKSLVDRVVNKAKKDDQRTREQLTNYLTSTKAVDKLYDDIAKRFPNRLSGFTRNVRIGARRGDNSMIILVEWVVMAPKSEPKKPVAGKITPKQTKESKPKPKKKAEKKKKDE